MIGPRRDWKTSNLPAPPRALTGNRGEFPARASGKNRVLGVMVERGNHFYSIVRPREWLFLWMKSFLA